MKLNRHGLPILNVPPRLKVGSDRLKTPAPKPFSFEGNQIYFEQSLMAAAVSKKWHENLMKSEQEAKQQRVRQAAAAAATFTQPLAEGQ